MSTSSITVEWERIPSNQESPIRGYTIMYKNWQSSETKYLQVGSFKSKATLINLEEGTKYIIQVAGRINGGVGAYSAPLIVETKQQCKSKII